jgi:histidine racemase
MNLTPVAVMYPSGNTTAIIQTPPDTYDKKLLNAEVLAWWKQYMPTQPEVEQVCYIDHPTDPQAISKVIMLGGEFCGNAARAVIQLLTKDRDCSGVIESSGISRSLGFTVVKGVISLEMPLQKNEEMFRTVDDGVLVQFEGIVQLVATDEARKKYSPRELLLKILSEKKYELRGRPAVGVTYFDPASKRASFCVWVKNVDTIFDETACGSGTAAIGAVEARRKKMNVEMRVIQPSNEWITVSSEYRPMDTQNAQTWIRGPVQTLFNN